VLTEVTRTLVEIATILDGLGVPYAVSGSVASSWYGEVRATNDIDVLVDLTPDRSADLATALRPVWYVDVDMAADAARRHRSFNAIHLSSMMKVDFYVCGADPLDRRQLERRVAVTLKGSEGRCAVWFTAPDDVVLRKLSWFRAGGEVSDRQWRDVVGVLKVLGDSLDADALRAAARPLGLGDLVERALRDAGRA
jgi:hypothetical protein